MKRLALERKGLVFGIAGVLAIAFVGPPALAAKGPAPPGSAAGVAGDCGQLADQAERATCFAVQLREADQANERLFQKLAGSLPETEQTVLRDTQRDWAAKRNQACGLDDDGAPAGEDHGEIGRAHV